jgi:hypothetical protein
MRLNSTNFARIESAALEGYADMPDHGMELDVRGVLILGDDKLIVQYTLWDTRNNWRGGLKTAVVTSDSVQISYREDWITHKV